jgi:beta-galactosidase
MGGVEPQIRTDNPRVQARLHEGAGGAWLWIVNPERVEQKVQVTLPGALGDVHSASEVWGGRQVSVAGPNLTATVPARDADVVQLR